MEKYWDKFGVKGIKFSYLQSLKRGGRRRGTDRSCNNLSTAKIENSNY